MNNTNRYNMTLIGCGQMGQAMLRSWIKQDIAQNILVVDPSNLPQEFTNEPNITHISHYGETHNPDISEDILILAIKPQILQTVCTSIKDKVTPNTLVMSIAAGKTLQNLDVFFPNNPIVRVMPNTPASIGKGANVVVANNRINESHKKMTHDVLTACGFCSWIEDETLMDAVTALSGSGPAYVFYLIETLAKAGEKQGLPAETAKQLARQTVIGSAALADHEEKKSPETLRKNVTSPKGTTEAALNILMDGRLDNIFIETLGAAVARSKELKTD